MFDLAYKDIIDTIDLFFTGLIALFGLLINKNIQKNNRANQRDEVIGEIVSAVSGVIYKNEDLDNAIIEVQMNANKAARLFSFEVAMKVNLITGGLSKLKRAMKDTGFEESQSAIISEIKEHSAALVLGANRTTGNMFSYSLSSHEHLTSQEVVNLIFPLPLDQEIKKDEHITK